MIKGKLDDLDISILQIQNLEPEVQDYIENNKISLCKTYILTEISFLADAANLPVGFKQGLDVVDGGRGAVKIINRWGREDLPLAKWFNYGTRDHGPVFADALHWKDKITGKDIYAKFVRGVPRTEVMEKGIEIGMKYLIDFALRESKMKVSMKLGIV